MIASITPKYSIPIVGKEGLGVGAGGSIVGRFFFFCLVEVKVILVTWEHLLNNFMQPIYAGVLRPSYTTGHHRVSRYVTRLK